MKTSKTIFYFKKGNNKMNTYINKPSVKKFAAILVTLSAVSLSGCLGAHDNPLLGHWKLESVSTTSDAPLLAVDIAQAMNQKAIGEHVQFTPTEMISHLPGGPNTSKVPVVKYEVRDSGKKVVVVQDQHQGNIVIRENQDADFSDGGDKVTLHSGTLILHLKKD